MLKENDLGGDFSNVSKEGFSTALETSAYSLIPIVKNGSSLMKMVAQLLLFHLSISKSLSWI